MEKDLYEVLGVDRKADQGALKSAYRKLAMQYHPDRNPDDAESEKKFKEINAAYEILKDDQKRAAYDRYGAAAFTNGGGGGGFGGGFGAGGFADIFEEMFGDFMHGGAAPGRGRNMRGSDIRYNMEIDLEDAFHGKETAIKVGTSAVCEECDGSGAREGAHPVDCTTCNGRGKIRAQQGFFMIERTCHTCQGAGQVIDDPCSPCQGSGRVHKQKELKVKIPPGVETGSRIRLSGEGEAGMRGAPAGDLYIFMSVRPHGIFEREGEHLFCQVPIAMVTAAMGGEIEIPTVDGKKAKLHIPSGTQSGQRFRLKEKGMPILQRKSRGDMYVEMMVETPMNLTDKQKELLAEFQQEAKEDQTSPKAASFFGKIKDFLQ